MASRWIQGIEYLGTEEELNEIEFREKMRASLEKSEIGLGSFDSDFDNSRFIPKKQDDLGGIRKILSEEERGYKRNNNNIIKEPIPDPKARERELRDKLEGRKHFFGMPKYRLPNTHKGKDFTPNEIALLNYPKRDKLNDLLILKKGDLDIPEITYLDYLEGHKLNKDSYGIRMPSLNWRTTLVSAEQYFRMLGELFNMDEDIARCFVEELEGQTYSITDAKPINKSFTSFEKRKITEDYQAGLEQAF